MYSSIALHFYIIQFQGEKCLVHVLRKNLCRTIFLGVLDTWTVPSEQFRRYFWVHFLIRNRKDTEGKFFYSEMEKIKSCIFLFLCAKKIITQKGGSYDNFFLEHMEESYVLKRYFVLTFK